MRTLNGFTQTLVTVAGSLCYSTIAHAQPATVTYAASPHAAVPTLGNALLITLGVVLALIALYTLRRRQGQKLLSVLLLGGGLVLGGVGVDRSVANGYYIVSTVEVSDTDCAGNTEPYDMFAQSARLDNLCPHPIRVISCNDLPCGQPSPACPTNVDVDANGGNVFLPVCAPPPPD